ncbi:MAG TPA: arsenosugar biosynthesis radical SAM (seleno)protein ArsS, partial [Verrucomicrobiae bacterium]|nr:arsenosugar biosynthesis radical SAM (seleno)protein ArsS [Verrucomicrobiae bacterium]
RLMNRFEAKLTEAGLTLRRTFLETLQLNVGRKCNQACRHCHVDAAPWRTEMMGETTAQRIGAWIQQFQPPIVDLTGGAPELNAFFPFLVQTARGAGCHVIDRNNLTILEEPGFAWLPEFLAGHEVEVVASLPCYLPENVTKQRGAGVYEKSIRALRKLNAVGYGTKHTLNLVYNPVGATLPGPQAELEADYKEALQRDHGIIFHHLYTITNQPIARFAEDLRAHGFWEDYLELLAHSFNPTTVDGLMCRSTLSVDHEGRLYDCDFNQMLAMHLTRTEEKSKSQQPLYLWDIQPADLNGRSIETGVHCLACTAGCGSSCTGALER